MNYYEKLKELKELEANITNNLVHKNKILNELEEETEKLETTKNTIIDEKNIVNNCKNKIELHSYIKYLIKNQKEIVFLLVVLSLIAIFSKKIENYVLVNFGHGSDINIILYSVFFDLFIISMSYISFRHQKNILKKSIKNRFGTDIFDEIERQKENELNDIIQRQENLDNIIKDTTKEIIDCKEKLQKVQEQIKKLNEITDAILEKVCSDDRIIQQIVPSIPKTKNYSKTKTTN